MIEAIFFDFSETLVQGTLDINACRKSVVKLFCSKGYQVSRSQYDRAMEDTLCLRRLKKLEGREMNSEQMEKNTLTLLKIEPSRSLLSEIEDLEFRQYTWKVLPGVKKSLAHLAKHFRLGIISNSASDSVVRVLKKENLLPLFDAVVLSKDVGFRKPDSRIFERALETEGICAENALYVGDNYIQDVLGAKQSGMKTIWMTKQRDIRASYFDGVAHSIGEVPRIVEKLEDGFKSKNQADVLTVA